MVNRVLPAPASWLGRTKLNVEEFPSQTVPTGGWERVSGLRRDHCAGGAGVGQNWKSLCPGIASWDPQHWPRIRGRRKPLARQQVIRRSLDDYVGSSGSVSDKGSDAQAR